VDTDLQAYFASLETPDDLEPAPGQLTEARSAEARSAGARKRPKPGPQFPRWADDPQAQARRELFATATFVDCVLLGEEPGQGPLFDGLTDKQRRQAQEFTQGLAFDHPAVTNAGG